MRSLKDSVLKSYHNKSAWCNFSFYIFSCAERLQQILPSLYQQLFATRELINLVKNAAGMLLVSRVVKN